MAEETDDLDQAKQAKRERNVRWERRFQSVMMMLTVSGICWTLGTVVTGKVDLAKMTTRLDAMDVQMSGAYRSSDAHRDVAEMLGRATTNERNIQALSGSVQALDGRLRAVELKGQGRTP